MNKIREEYLDRYGGVSTKAPRTIGLEVEIPVVRRDGHSITPSDIMGLFREIAATSQGRLVLAKDGMSLDMVRNGKVDPVASIGTDYGSGLLEIGFPVTDSLSNAERTLRAILNPVIATAEANGIYLLGYGSHPATIGSKNYMMPKDRYEILTEVFGGNNGKEGIFTMAVVSATHVHYGVRPAEFIGLTNVLNGFAPALIALSANSAINGGQNTGLHDLHSKAWDHLIPNDCGSNGSFLAQRDLTRKGIAPIFRKIDDIWDTLIGYTPFLTKRDDRYLRFLEPRSMREHLTSGNALVADVNGNMTQIDIRPIEIKFLEGTVWWEARPRSTFGTVESRSASTQPSIAEMVAVASVGVGFLHNLAAAEALVSRFDLNELREAREEALTVGLDGRIGRTPIREFAAEGLKVIRRGLQAAGEDEQYVDLLEERLTNGKNPAQRSIEIFNDGGIEGILEAYRLRRS